MASLASLRDMAMDFNKLERFDGGDFYRWQRKMFFLLTTLKVYYPITTPRPELGENATLAQIREGQRWDQDDEICRGHILNAMSNTLFDAYHNVPTAKELWTQLQTRYMKEDAASKRFIITKFNSYKMIDSRSVMEQFNELKNILDHFTQYKLKMDEPIIVTTIIDKLPPSWKNVRNGLKHKKEDLTLEELGNHLQIEEDLRKESKDESFSKIHAVEEGESSKKPSQDSRKRKHPSKSAKHAKDNKKKKGACFHCGKPGHFKKECWALKKKNNAPDNFVAVVSEANILEDHEAWWIDSGATRHVCKEKSFFKAYEPVNDGKVLYMGNSSTAQVKGIGTVQLEFTSGKTLTLNDVYHVPEIRKNLVSGSLLNKNGFKLVFEADKFVLSKGGAFVGKGYMYDSMFKLNINNKTSTISAYIVECPSLLWHNRLGHVNIRKMHDMVKLELLPRIDINMEKCRTCMLTKITRKPFPNVQSISNLLELIHSDLCDMHSTPSLGGKKYFITFIDNYSRFCYVYLLNSKDEAMNKFNVYKNEVELQCDAKIKCLRTDRGGEYYDPSYFESNGIIHETTAPYTPQQNGVAERKNRTLKEMVNAMLSNSGLGHGFWGEALLTACYILNRVPTKRNKATPYELWKKRKPSLSYFKVWGCRAIVRVPEPKRKNLGERGIECIFLGYAQHSKAYRFMVVEPNNYYSVNSIIESRDAIFDEKRFKTLPKSILDKDEQEQFINKEVDIKKMEPRRSKRIKTPKTYGSDFYMYLVEGTRNEIGSSIPIVFNMDSDPKTFEEAMKSQDAAFWKEAINDEMDSIMGNNTWKLVDLPPGSKPIGCKWIFKRKLRADGTIDKFKARLVAKGFTQKEGVDYFDTYAPVARIATIRVLIAMASIYKLVIHQMDVKTAFLNGELDEEVYMKQPEGFIVKGQEQKVCKLVKSLYGLKQAPKQWHQKFDQVVLSNGFKVNESDKCVYSRFINNKGVIICLYVDDMLIFGTDLEQVQNTKEFLSKNFDMKDMGEADVILGIRIIKNNDGLILTQSHYIEKVLKRFEHFDSTPVSTPYDSSVKLIRNEGRAVAQLEYASAIGCLMYAMTCTRPDIAFAVGKLSRFTSCPSTEHWGAVHRVFKYLKKTINYGIHYKGYPTVLEGFTDASWITDQRDDHASTSGWIFTLGGGVISWASKKQTCISDSTMASEFIALAAGGKEAEWLRNLLFEIPLWPKPMAPISIRCDSEATLSRAYSQIYNGKSRHIGLRHSYVRQLITDGVITIEFVRSLANLADPLTKGLARDMVTKTSQGMGLKPTPKDHQ